LKYGIVTDSTSDISVEEAEAFNIEVIPAILVVDGIEYQDGKGLSREDYYNQLSDFSPPPTTASPSSGMFTETYQKLFDRGVDRILSIHVASTLSGIMNAAQIGAKTFGNRVQVIDSGQLSLGLGFQVLGAAKTALTGNIRRSGRVNWLRSGLGSLLRIKLFLAVRDSEILRLGETRTRSKGIQRLSEMIETIGALEQLAIVHTNALDEATQLADKYSSQVHHPPLIRNVTTVIGTHVGINAIGFISIKAE
jgi:fatty acid-binding protein DegV